MTQIYGSGALQPALDLKPEEGTHYEIGYKLNAEKSAWRLAIFNYEVKDSVEAVKYVDAKFSSTLKANFVGDRTSDTKEQRHIKPQLFTDWHFAYQPQENHKVFLHIDNILDRRDIVSTGNSNYYNLGRNFILGYEYIF